MSVWGSGKPLRQFCYTPDLALLLLWVTMRKSEAKQSEFSLIALIPTEEDSIGDLAKCIANEFKID